MINKINKVLNVIFVIFIIIFLFTVISLKMDFNIHGSEISQKQLKNNIIFSENSTDDKYNIILVAKQSKTITLYITDLSNEFTFEYFSIELNDNVKDYTYNLNWKFDETVLTVSNKELDTKKYTILLEPYSKLNESVNTIENMYSVFY